MMNTDQILKVLKNERECIARQGRPLGERNQVTLRYCASCGAKMANAEEIGGLENE